MKYYYNGQLVRTSDHVYTHAVIDTKTGKAIACRNGAEAAEAAKNAELSSARSNIKYFEDMIKAMKAGQNHFSYKIGRCTARARIADDMTIEKAENKIEQLKAWIEKRRSELIVVPLTSGN